MSFTDSHKYWKARYESGRNSGKGSYGKLAEFKASFLNAFVLDNNVKSVVELGCGDGNQLKYSRYPIYTGYDISPTAIQWCKSEFLSDKTKEFFELTDDVKISRSDLAISLDVIYHLVEDDVFDRHIVDLFASAIRFVIIYSSNRDQITENPHVRHRRFSSWVENRVSGFEFVSRHQNAARGLIDENGNRITTPADFYIYARI